MKDMCVLHNSYNLPCCQFSRTFCCQKSCCSRQRFFNYLFSNIHFTHKTCLFSWPFLDIKNKALQLVSGECTGERISFFPFRQYNNNNNNNIERRIQVLAFTSLRCRLMHEALQTMACQQCPPHSPFLLPLTPSLKLRQ